MNHVVRGVIIYFVLLLFFRLTGKRTLAQITTFDFVLLLIISEATQPALTGNDYSMTNSLVVILTLLMLDIGLSLVTRRFANLEKAVDGVPSIIVENGKPLKERMKRLRVQENDIMETARERVGLERMDQIKYAVMERNGLITIIPQDNAR